MKFFANLKKLNKLGASMVEYAIVLACISAFGASFSDNLTNVLEKPFNSIATILGLASNQQSAKDIAFTLFTDSEMNKISGNRWESFGREIASNGDKYIEDYYFNKIGLDTAYSIVGEYAWSKLPKPADVGLAVDGGKNYKLITIADKNGVSCAVGNFNDESTHFSATQYLLCEKNGMMNIVATRELSTVCITTTGNHFSDRVPNNKNEPKYSLNNNFSKASYKDKNENWIDVRSLENGFIKYAP